MRALGIIVGVRLIAVILFLFALVSGFSAVYEWRGPTGGTTVQPIQLRPEPPRREEEREPTRRRPSTRDVRAPSGRPSTSDGGAPPATPAPAPAGTGDVERDDGAEDDHGAEDDDGGDDDGD